MRSHKTGFLDSGASRHITNDISRLHNARPLEEEVQSPFGNGEQAKATAIGEVVLTNLLGSSVSKSY